MSAPLLAWVGPLIGALAGLGIAVRLRPGPRPPKHEPNGPIMITESGRWITQDGREVTS